MPEDRRFVPNSWNSGELVIHLTQVTPICSVQACGRLSADTGRIRDLVQHRGGVPRLPRSAAMARRLRLSELWGRESVASAAPVAPMCRLWPTDLGDGRHHWSSALGEGLAAGVPGAEIGTTRYRGHNPVT